MGCDIHMHIELKINGKWENYATPRISRWYRLFGLLADVRNYDSIKPISLPKGLPEDISVITKISRNIMSRDGHSDSWLSAEEIIVLEDTLKEWGKESEDSFLEYDLEHGILHTYLFGNSFTCHIRYEDCPLPEGIEDVRFVFWFDS